MCSFDDVAFLRSRPPSERFAIIDKIAHSNYDSLGLEKLLATVSESLPVPLDLSMQKILTICILAVLAADIGTIAYSRFQEDEISFLKRHCEDFGISYRDVVQLSEKGDELLSWFKDRL